MPSRSALPAAWISALLAMACAANPAPEGFLPTRVQAQTMAYGGWIELMVDSANSRKQQRVEGELLAVTADSVWVLSTQGARVIATGSVKEGRLTAYQSQTGAITGWTALGVLSTASNGVVLILTAPLWIITGTIAGINESHAPVRDVPGQRWEDLAAFGRFPQGMPAGVALQSLKPRN